MASKSLKLSVQNFGPVRQGEFTLKPLTVFIGPNNSGKSYMALLVYVLCRAFSSGPLGSQFERFRRGFSTASSRPEGIEGMGRDLLDWLLSASSHREGVQNAVFAWEDIPASVQKALSEGIQQHRALLDENLVELFRDYFGFQDARELIQQHSESKSLSVSLNEAEEQRPFLGLRLRPSGEKWLVEWGGPDIDSLGVRIPDLDRILAFMAKQSLFEVSLLLDALLETLWHELMAVNGFPGGNAYYLPAARSGILNGWQAFASMAVQLLRRRVGLERVEVPAFTGVAGDFLQVLLERVFQRPRRPVSSSMAPVLEILEGHIFQGQVAFQTARSEQPLILYRSGNLRLPIHRASSMVAELAPLSLWVSRLLVPGDLLIIDEPEAHLHPESQRNIARVLVRLVRAGVNVICTTHSSLILHQLSNHLLASEARPEAYRGLGFTSDDVLSDRDLGVYLFERQENGTQIKPVPTEPGFGISEEEFVRVMEAIGEETHLLSRASQRDEDGSP